MKILIAGGGIGGLACAALLKQRGFSPLLIEQAPEFKTIGYAIGLWEGGQNVLEQLGVLEKFVEKSHPVPRGGVADAHGNSIFDINFAEILIGHRVSANIRRSDLHALLLEAAEGVDMRLGITIKDILQNKDSVTVELNDGSRDTFDLLIAADGMHSRIREKVFGPRTLEYYGWAVYVAWIDGRNAAHPDIFPDKSQYYLRRDQGVLMIPLGDNTYVAGFLVRRKAGLSEQPGARLVHIKTLFKGFCPVVEEAIMCIDESKGIFLDDLCHVKIREWYRGRVVLLGDSRHGVPPHTGLGASLALQDALVLAEELAKHTPILETLARYAARRTPNVHYIQFVSKIFFHLIFIHGRILTFLREVILPHIPKKLFLRFLIKKLVEMPV